MDIGQLLKKHHKAIDRLDLELLISHVINKSREFFLSHPERELTKNQQQKIKSLVSRRKRGEPLAYILGRKEFYGLEFKVNKNTLVPRPETEFLTELALGEIQVASSKRQAVSVIDVGTGSGNIIISIAKNLSGSRLRAPGYRFYATDISAKALRVAEYNAKKHKVDEKIKFLKGNLLKPLIKHWELEIGNSRIIILANLPYLSQKIYARTSPSVKNYEPKSALLSKNFGLAHYEKLFKQIHNLKIACPSLHTACYLEISPEQKLRMEKSAKKHFPKARIVFFKDLAGRWRVCSFSF